MVKKTKSCIYCGRLKNIDKDHVPPQCFFPPPRPDNMITVPSCKKCNRDFGKIDERVRNLISSSENVEKHESIKNYISGKRDRSFLRKKQSNLDHVLNSMDLVHTYTESGIYLGKKPIINYDQEIFDKFLERLTRALIYNETSISKINTKINWYFPEDLFGLINEISQMTPYSIHKVIGINIFEYLGFYNPNSISSLWILCFYSSIIIVTWTSENLRY